MKNNRILIKNGRVIDPAANIDEILDILIEGGRIICVARDIKNGCRQVIDAAGKIVMPGLVDMHVHLRQPGREDKETIASGTAAALKGGVTSVLAMPNTLPAIDSEKNAALLRDIIEKDAQANVFICGAISTGRQGKELTDLARMRKVGVSAFSDDGSSVDDVELMLKAFKKAREHKALIICHCEDKALCSGGVVNLGFTSTRLGLRGISRESEYRRIERDIALSMRAKAPIHIAHVSCRESMEIIALAKKKGADLTCETAPHYFCLTEEAVLGYDTNMKINPPLRSKDDVEAIKQGLCDGIIDAIASDHAPHTENEKDIEFERAEFGTIGLETELAAAITELVHPGIIDWLQLSAKMSLNPSRILGINKGHIAVGRDADIVIVDPDEEWTVRKEDFVSQSSNSAFIGRKLKGVVEYTICGGKIAYKNKGPAD